VLLDAESSPDLEGLLLSESMNSHLFLKPPSQLRHA
jgi:hypothetical protein